MKGKHKKMKTDTLQYIAELIENKKLILDPALFISPRVIIKFYILLKLSENEKTRLSPEEWAWHEEIRYCETKFAFGLFEEERGILYQYDRHNPNKFDIGIKIMEELGGCEKVAKEMKEYNQELLEKWGINEHQRRSDYSIKIENFYGQ